MITVPRQRLSVEDRVWINARAPEQPVKEERAGEDPEPEKEHPELSELVSALVEDFVVYAEEGGITRVAIEALPITEAGAGAFRHPVARALIKRLLEVGVLEIVDTGSAREESAEEEADLSRLQVELLADPRHREGYLALSVLQRGTDEPAWSRGGYFLLTENDREWLGLRPLTREDRFLPRLTASSLQELDELKAVLAGWKLLLPRLGSSEILERKVLQHLLAEHLVLPLRQELERSGTSRGDAAPEKAPEEDSSAEDERSGELAEDEETAPEIPSAMVHLEKVREGLGTAVYDARLVEEGRGTVLAVVHLTLERETETEEFLRERMAEYHELEKTGDAGRALEICRWADEGQRVTLLSSTRSRHQSYLARSRDYRHELGEVRVSGDCGVVIIRTIYSDGRGSGQQLMVLDQGEWKVWPFSAPRAGQHRFSEDQRTRLIELQEWAWNQRGVPEEVRQRIR